MSNLSPVAVDPVDIIIPVYNGKIILSRCVTSILAKTNYPFKLTIVDDASPDQEFQHYLSSLEKDHRITVIHNPKNLGFVGSVNVGMRQSSNDVVLLNSDTEVTTGWLKSLRACISTHLRVASASPLTSYGSIFAIPRMCTDNPLISGYNPEAMANLVQTCTERRYPEVPTTNGFCMYIRREALNQVGFFNEKLFGRGYGEENDFCMRAKEAGWMHLADDATYVFHLGNKTFSDEKNELIIRNRKILDSLYPYYTKMVQDWIKVDPLRYVRERVRQAINKRVIISGGHKRPAILFVTHAGRGGTYYTNIDLMRALAPKFQCYELCSNCKQLAFRKYEEDNRFDLGCFQLEQPVQLIDNVGREYQQIVESVIDHYNINLLHIRHLLGHTFDIVFLARKRNIPVVLSFHDGYFICPSIHLIDNRNVFCGGVCNDDPDDCPMMKWWFLPPPHLKNKFVKHWRKRVEHLLEQVDSFVTTSRFARNLYCRNYPKLVNRDFRIIPHGRDFNDTWCYSPELTIPGNIVTIGSIDKNKGLETLNRLAKILPPTLARLHIFGNISGPLHRRIIHHGQYFRDDLPKIVKPVNPTLALFPNLSPDTFCHSLSEAWALGLPALVPSIGALHERVSETNGGWIFNNMNNPKGLASKIENILYDEADFRKRCQCVAAIRQKNVASMADEYSSLYFSLIGNVQTGSGYQILPAAIAVERARCKYGQYSQPVFSIGKTVEIDAPFCYVHKNKTYYPTISRRKILDPVYRFIRKSRLLYRIAFKLKQAIQDKKRIF